MAKLTQYENPLTGKKGNLFNVMGLWQQVLGFLVLFGVMAFSQKIGNKVENKVKYVDVTPNSPFGGNVSVPSTRTF